MGTANDSCLDLPSYIHEMVGLDMPQFQATYQGVAKREGWVQPSGGMRALLDEA